MRYAPPAGTRGGNPSIEVFHTKNLQNLQAQKIQDIIMSLQSPIPTDTEMIKPETLQAQSHQDLITQEEENHTTPPTPSDADVEEWRRMLEGGSLGPPPTLLPTTNNPTQGTVASPHHEKWGSPLTLEDVCTA